MEQVGTVDELFDRHYAAIVRALAVAFDDAEGAADAVQEAFIQAARRWHRISAYDEPAVWVRRVAINRMRNGRRNRRRRSEIVGAIRPVPREDLTDEMLDLRRAIDELPEKMRLAVTLHHVAGLPIEAVAATLEVTEGTVKSNLHDARLRLRADLEDRTHG